MIYIVDDVDGTILIIHNAMPIYELGVQRGLMGIGKGGIEYASYFY